MTGPSKVRVLVVDDHALFAEGLRELLCFHDDLEVVGIAGSAEQALVDAPRLAPDVVLMDLHMPGLDGVAATRRLTARSPRPAVLALTMYDDDASLFAVLRAGARGYVLKGAHQEELVSAIRAVARGEAVFDARVADRVLSHVGAVTAAQALPELTERERQVLALLAAGRPTAEIADRLQLSPKTVRNYLSSVFAKLQVADRAQAVLRARDAGLTE
ncbi:response regulator [Geodermatophilus sp. SYSU D00691]